MTPYAPSQKIHDALIIGGGPGGLTAAIYLRRFRRDVILVDKGNSRLGWIPVSHNYPGFVDGIHGQDLLDNLRGQLQRYGGEVTQGEIVRLTREDDVFVAGYEGADALGEIRARKVLIATGVADAGMPMENFKEAVACGAIRLCPVCDGYDVLDQRVAVVTSNTNPVGHALFMRTFTSHVTLFERNGDALVDEDTRCALREAGVAYVTSPLKGVSMTHDMKPVLHTDDGEDHLFDVLYPLLGEAARSDLALGLGAETAECAKLVVDDGQQTTVPGLYAIGDVVRGLNQISVAVGQAAVAATRMHNAMPYTFRPRLEKLVTPSG